MSDFHFLRPLWLLGLLPAALVGWRLWASSDAAHAWRGIVAPHLLKHLLVGAEKHSRFNPITLLVVSWVVAVVALAGPAWQREPAPFADDSATLVIVLKVTPSMKSEDVQPTRLARAVQKIHDLNEQRLGAKTALVVYSGSAHRVMPPTTDAGIIDSFASELSPGVMPKEGDSAADALKLADDIIAKSGQRGWVLWIADAADGGQTPALTQHRNDNRAPVSVLAVAGDGPERASLKTAADALGADFVPVTPDDADVQHLAGNTRFSVAAEGMGERWRDAGYYVVPVLAVMCLFWFRRGWVARAGGVS